MPQQQCPCLTIAVAAGKGGTGKTLVSTSLAQALCTLYPGQVQFLDCDVEEPNAHLLLRPEISGQEPVTVLVPEVDLGVCTRCGRCAEACQNNAIAVIRQAVVTFPELCSGCGACAYVCRAGAIREVTRHVGTVHLGRTDEALEFVAGELNVGDQKATPVTHAVKRHIRQDRLSIIDAPPGTACPMQETVDESDFCLLVTEPTPFGLSDLRLAVETCRGLGIPCGVLVNRAGSGFDGVDEYCEAEGLPLVGRIEQDRAIAEAYSRGQGLLTARREASDLLLAVFARIEKLIVQEVNQDD